MRTSSADRNCVAIGSADNILTFDNTVVDDQAKTDAHIKALLDGRDKSVAWASLFKIGDSASSLDFGTVEAPLVIDGPAPGEGWLDGNNRVGRINLIATLGEPGQVAQRVQSWKGGCHDITTRNLVRARGNLCELLVGDYSDQTNTPVHDCTFDDRHEDGKPLRAIVGWTKNVRLGPNYKVRFWLSLGLKLYVPAKAVFYVPAAALIAKLSKQKNALAA